MAPATLNRADGHTLAYQRSVGHEPGVIFLGGFRSDMTGTKALTLENWCRQQERAFVRFDYFGHGASSGCFADATIGRWRDDACAVLDQLSAGPQILVGSSLGGWLMVLTALARPARVAGLIGIATAADFTEELIWAQLDAAARARLQQDGVLYQPSDYSTEPYPITLKLIEEGRQHLVLHAPIALTCPVRLLHGMDDSDVPWQTSLRLAEWLASCDVRITLIKDGEHRLSREQDLQLLLAMLAELTGSKRSTASIG
jgi:pimeloyl-ACP methyl ester carboxylesterase